MTHFVLANETTVFLLVTALDFFVTYVLLAWPGSPAYEVNPIARRVLGWGFHGLIAFKFGLAAVGVVCCEVVARRNRRLGRAVLVGMTVLVAAVAVYGVGLIVRHVVRV
jgi:hypothetical protein